MTFNDIIGLVILIAFSLLLGIAGLLISHLIAPKKPNLTKRLRYETGNPPKGRARGVLSMQYYPYILLFLIVEPIFLFLFLVIPAINRGLEYVTTLGIVFLIYILPVYYGVKLARTSSEW